MSTTIFTGEQISIALQKLSIPSDYEEFEAVRRLILNLYRKNLLKSSRSSSRKSAQSDATMFQDIVTSNEPPTILIERFGVSIQTVHAIKAGYGNYQKFGGIPSFWADYRRVHKKEIKELIIARRNGGAK